MSTPSHRVWCLGLACAVMIGACTRGRPEANTPEKTETRLRSEGGVASSKGGELSVTFPLGAIDSEVVVSIETDRATMRPHQVGPLFALSTSPPAVFKKPVDLVIKAPSGSRRVLVAQFDDPTATIVSGSSYDSATKSARAALTHFSTYGLVETATHAACDSDARTCVPDGDAAHSDSATTAAIDAGFADATLDASANADAVADGGLGPDASMPDTGVGLTCADDCRVASDCCDERPYTCTELAMYDPPRYECAYSSVRCTDGCPAGTTCEMPNPWDPSNPQWCFMLPNIGEPCYNRKCRVGSCFGPLNLCIADASNPPPHPTDCLWPGEHWNACGPPCCSGGASWGANRCPPASRCEDAFTGCSSDAQCCDSSYICYQGRFCADAFYGIPCSATGTCPRDWQYCGDDPRFPGVPVCLLRPQPGERCIHQPNGDTICDVRTRCDPQTDTCLCDSPPPPNCGDGVKGPDEYCDGNDFGGLTCASFNYYSGALRCSPDCRIVDKSNCIGRCGDGIINSSFEECDGLDLGGATCIGPPLERFCSNTCELDRSYCRPPWCGADPDC